MAYSTAISFVLVGLGLGSLAFRRRGLAIGAAALLGLIALAAIVHYATGWPDKLETLLSRFTLPQMAITQPMAPNTACAFLMIAIAIWLSGIRPEFRWKAALIALAGSAGASLGLNALLGYPTGLQTYLWGQFKPMAIHTSAGLIVAGVGALGFYWRHSRMVRKEWRAWALVIVATVGVVASFSFRQAFSLTEQLYLEPSMQSALPETVLIFGLLVTGLLGASIYLAETARRRTRLSDELRLETERAMQSLGASERKYRTLLESLPQKIAYKDRNGIYISCNENYANDLRLTPATIAGKTDYDFFPKELAEKYRADDRHVMATGQVAEIEEEYCRQGRKEWVQTVKSPVCDEDGNIAGVIVIFWDITERKRVERELVTANAYNRSLIEASLDPLVTIAPDGKITDVNRATEEVTGCSRGELIGTEFSAYFTDPRKAREGYQQVFREGLVQDYELAIRRRDAHVTPVVYNASLYRDKSGNVIGVFAAARDVTERKRAERELGKANAYNRSLIEASLDPLVTIAQNGRITDVNRATEEVTGFPRAELIGTEFSDYFTEPEKARAGYEQVFREGLVKDFELAIRRRDGYVTPVVYNASVYRDESRKVIGVFAAARNISQRKRAEEALERKALDLARSNADLEQFAYVASHDLQEPLRMVANFTQLLADRYRNQLGQEGAEFIAYAVDGATRMQRLIQDLLTYSRVGTRGKSFEPTDCNEVLGSAVANLQAAIQETHAVVTHEELPTVPADPSQLTQVFQNLVGNAIKFRSEQAPRVHVSAARQQTRWVFSVQDNGIGIDAVFAERIFVIFQRLHSRSEYPGTGIGLALCKKIVERHGGQIWVESEPGQGARFLFTIPASL